MFEYLLFDQYTIDLIDSSMPSTRKQKAKERRSRQLDMLSDVENVDIILGSYSRDDEENNISENEVNMDSVSNMPQQNSNVFGEHFRSLLKTNSKENSEITIETTRRINEEISNQLSRKLNKIENSFNVQIQVAISSAITEKNFHLSKIRWKCKRELIIPWWTGGPSDYKIVQNQLFSQR